MHKKISDINFDGFTASCAGPGEPVLVCQKDWVTSEAPLFYVYAEQIASAVFPKLEVVNLKNAINRYLIVIHPDNTADVFWDEIAMISKVKLKIKRSVKKREILYSNDIENISEVRFSDITINPNDRVIFLDRSGWKFGLFFDFTREINLDTLAADIAKIQNKLMLEDVLNSALAEIQSAEKKENEYEAFIITEGKSDWRHIEKAFEKIRYNSELSFQKNDEDLGDAGLLELCSRLTQGPPIETPVICIFDRDNKVIQNKLKRKSSGKETEYQSWGNNVFSMILPKPDNRKDYKNISIEMYYPDEVIRRKTPEGKRLFFDNELRIEVLPGQTTKKISISPVNKHELNKKIDSKDVDKIEDVSGHKVGLSKTAFAEMIYTEQSPFKDVDFGNFKYISKVLEKILITSRTSNSK